MAYIGVSPAEFYLMIKKIIYDICFRWNDSDDVFTERCLTREEALKSFMVFKDEEEEEGIVECGELMGDIGEDGEWVDDITSEGPITIFAHKNYDTGEEWIREGDNQ